MTYRELLHALEDSKGDYGAEVIVTHPAADQGVVRYRLNGVHYHEERGDWHLTVSPEPHTSR